MSYRKVPNEIDYELSGTDLSVAIKSLEVFMLYYLASTLVIF